MTETQTLTLADFLLARLDEDYEVAYGAAPSPWREGDGYDGTFEGARQVLDRHGDVTAVAYYGGTYGHVLRFDPTRVLADIEAKREIVKRALAAQAAAREMFTGLGFDRESAWRRGMFDGFDHAVRLLALPYAAHSDYQESWRP